MSDSIEVAGAIVLFLIRFVIVMIPVFLLVFCRLVWLLVILCAAPDALN